MEATVKKGIAAEFDTPNRDYFIQYTTKKTQPNNAILGKGSYGIVFRALYKGKKAAVKIINKSDSYKFSSMSRERNIMNLSHKNIIKILKIVETKEYGAIIMERFDCGKNLQFVLDRCEKVDLIHRLKILRDISNGLKFCHANNIIHRDLKPDNLMIVLDFESNEYICKIFDFGCSFKINLVTRDNILKNNSLEENDISTSIVGTVRYSAPELLQGIPPTKSIDVYSFGVLMWQLKENEIPYESIKSNEIIIWQVVKNSLRPDSTLFLLPELNERGEIRRENSNKCLRPNLLSLEVPKTYHTPAKTMNSNKKTSKSDFKHDKKFLSKCTVKNSQIFTRKKLFNSNFFESLSTENDTGDETLNVFINFLTDQHLHLRNYKNLCKVENEYVRLYKACWDEKPLLRPDVEKICNLIEKFINYL